LGPHARPAPPGPPHRAVFEQRLHEPRIVRLAGTEQQHEGLPAAVVFRTQRRLMQGAVALPI